MRNIYLYIYTHTHTHTHIHIIIIYGFYIDNIIYFVLINESINNDRRNDDISNIAFKNYYRI